MRPKIKEFRMNLSPSSSLYARHTSALNNPALVDPEQRPAFGVRIADIAALLPDGSTVFGQRKIPTTKQFDQAFGAFAQGTLFQAPSGFVAVEDLRPGDQLTTSGGGQQTVVWIGCATFAPSDLGTRMTLTRVMADSFGVNRPQSFLSLGTAARVLQTPAGMRGVAGDQKLMTPASQFVDGVNVIEVAPPTPIRLFHVALRHHAPMIAGGLEVESFHPGTQPLQMLSHTLRSVYLSVFPHIENLSDFGTLCAPRAPDEDSQSAA